MGSQSSKEVESSKWIEEKEKELRDREAELVKRENDLKMMKKALEEEQRVNKGIREKEYRLYREVGQLKAKISQWESEEEERQRRMADMHRRKREEDKVRKRVRIEEEEREKLLDERRKRPRYN